ncbi:hypothetical protein LTR37_006365 [Vermiconidia calcicola]|uniref:Uncharacterized protein n=1 Tax=Vermiconidia calcicola TaxID=1690605 RepID=A0ACC3NGD7_9PEZI|nr:hypothetical protein LTR37_006365 [Vermiconidia calcicola]
MNASHSPESATRAGEDVRKTPNGHRSPIARAEEERKGIVSPVRSIEGGDVELPDAPAPTQKEDAGREENAGDSEAETEIESPVKKREAEKQHSVVRSEKPQRSRIGSLPVPHDDDEEYAESATASPVETREVSLEKANSTGDAQDEDAEMPDEDEKDDDSDDLSSPRSDAEDPPSRAASERPQQGQNGTADSPNPRKRKHRASSMSLPSSKRQSMDPPKRTRLRGMHSEDVGGRNDRSPSPISKAHRRTVSTQSFLDGTVEAASRRHKPGPAFPTRDPKSTKLGWEESSASSETTSRGYDELKRPQRGIGRSTSTPGRPGVAREHKRHVNKYGFTRLAEACEDGNMDLVKEWREKDPDQLELAEFAGNKPLQIAALNGNSEVVSYLIDQGCQIDCANVDKDTPLIDAAENGHVKVVTLLLEAGVDPLRQNLKGQQALDVVTDDTDDALGIRAALHRAIDRWNSSEAKQRREEEEEQRHRAGPSKELHFMARTYENLLKLVQNNDRNGVREFLAARVPVDNAVIASAARTGDLYLVNMLLAEMSEKKAGQKPEKPMLSVLGTSHFEMVKALTEVENFNAGWRSRSGKRWFELAEERAGPHWRAERELLLRLYEGRMRGAGVRRSSSPVTKRDGNKRRAFQQAGDDEESFEEVQHASSSRKNGRRLMSRKDMRAASGKGALSDSSDEDAPGEYDSAEATPAPTAPDPPAGTHDAEMMPPDSPGARRRLRSKSISSPEVTPKMAKTLRRRTSSLRDAQEGALPTLTEDKAEDKDSSDNGIVVSDKVKKESRVDEAKAAIEEAKRLEDKRMEAEKAEREARRAEEEIARKVEEERRVERERVAEQERVAEEARLKEQEEQARRDEEERKEARKRYEAQVLASLPRPLAHLLDPESSFRYEGEVDRSVLAQHFLPLRALPSLERDAMVLNLQAAPLLGQNGLQLFYKPHEAGYEGSLAATCSSNALEDDDWRIVDQILARLPFGTSNEDADGQLQDDELSMEEELRRTAVRHNAYIEAKRTLRRPDCAAALRRVRLEDVQRHLHPLFHDLVDVEFTVPTRREIVKQLDAHGEQNFVTRLRKFWEGAMRQPTGLLEASSTPGMKDAAMCTRFTDVVVVHEKSERLCA